MRNLGRDRFVRSVLLVGSALAWPGGAALAQSTGVADIVVTAQKREQNLQDVPISITAITADALAANRIQDVRDISALAPNLVVRIASGGSALPNYTLRGILTSGSAAGSDKGVALYLDGVYLQAVQGSIFEFADIERIEVLKGPQGTLFGRNATGGAISIISREPSGEFRAKQELTYGNYEQFRAKTSVDLPQFGPLSLSFTYLHSERNGDVRNLGAGAVWDYGPATGGRFGKYTSPKRLGDENTEGVMVAAKLDLTDDLDVVYRFDYTDSRSTPAAQGVAYLPSGSILSSIYDANLAAGNPMTPITTRRPDAVNNEFALPVTNKVQGHNLTIRYQVNDEISFKNILAYRKLNQFVPGFNLDGLGGLRNLPLASLGGLTPGFALQAGGPLATSNPDAPFLFLGNNASQKEAQWSNEFQVNVNNDAFNLTAGFLWFQDKISTAGQNDTFNTTILTAVDGQNTSAAGTPFVLPGNPGFERTRVKITSKAIFVQPEFHVTDRLDVVGGIRLTMDRKRGFEFYPNQSVLAGGRSIDYKNSAVSVMAGVNYRPNDDVLTYAKYATGYISGGQLATVSYEPETARSWEAGVKADLFDRRWRSNLAVFYVDYENIQYTTSGSLTGVPSALLFSQAVISSADARAYGFEWENTIIPTDGLTLTGNVGYTNFKFDQSTVFPGFAAASAPGRYLEFQRPKWTGNLAAQYEIPEVVAGGRAMFRVDANFRSKQVLSSDVSRDAGAGSFVDPALERAATVPFSWIVNARAGLMDMDLGATKASIAVWGKNIFDNDRMTIITGLDFGAAAGSVASAIYERARTYGADLTLSF